jgi:DNA-binding Lrp family transcriptional regulator
LEGSVISPTHGELAREIGASVRATRNYIDELKREKLIAGATCAGFPSGTHFM